MIATSHHHYQANYILCTLIVAHKGVAYYWRWFETLNFQSLSFFQIGSTEAMMRLILTEVVDFDLGTV